MLVIRAMRKSHFQTHLKNTVSFWGELVNEMIRRGRKSDKCTFIHAETKRCHCNPQTDVSFPPCICSPLLTLSICLFVVWNGIVLCFGSFHKQFPCLNSTQAHWLVTELMHTTEILSSFPQSRTNFHEVAIAMFRYMM